MGLIDKLERKMGRHYIPQLMKYLCVAMLGVFILDYLPMLSSASAFLYFNRARILRGEIWRVITFVFLPPDSSILWILFSLYFYYFLGTTLENRWGSARFNIYYALGVLGNILAGFISGYATNEYLNLSLFLAFATYYPYFEFTLFFVLPVKVRWIGLLDAALLIYQFLIGSWAMRLSLVLSLLPYFLFFGKQAYLQLKMDVRRLKRWISLKR